ncbi:hypothetical protein BGW80DRAFT_1347511, partial [Lactifluus volemus]
SHDIDSATEQTSLVDRAAQFQDTDVLFQPLLDAELQKISSFYALQEKQLLLELSELEELVKEQDDLGITERSQDPPHQSAEGGRPPLRACFVTGRWVNACHFFASNWRESRVGSLLRPPSWFFTSSSHRAADMQHRYKVAKLVSIYIFGYVSFILSLFTLL